MRQKGLVGELIAEVFGTFILILLGDGVVANVGLSPRVAQRDIIGTQLHLDGHSP